MAKKLKKYQGDKGSSSVKKSNAEKEYEAAYQRHKELREAYGKNSSAADITKLTKAYHNAIRLKDKAGLGLLEEAKLTFPHVGQQIRGAVNGMLGTHFKKGGNISKPRVRSTKSKSKKK